MEIQAGLAYAYACTAYAYVLIISSTTNPHPYIIHALLRLSTFFFAG